MRKCLWGVTQLLSRSRNLLREHAKVIRETEHVFKDVNPTDQILRVVDTSTSESFNEPECAHAESAFTATNTLKVTLMIASEVS
jgi:hypothetical protein